MNEEFITKIIADVNEELMSKLQKENILLRKKLNEKVAELRKLKRGMTLEEYEEKIEIARKKLYQFNTYWYSWIY